MRRRRIRGCLLVRYVEHGCLGWFADNRVDIPAFKLRHTSSVA